MRISVGVYPRSRRWYLQWSRLSLSWLRGGMHPLAARAVNPALATGREDQNGYTGGCRDNSWDPVDKSIRNTTGKPTASSQVRPRPRTPDLNLQPRHRQGWVRSTALSSLPDLSGPTLSSRKSGSRDIL